MLGDAVIHKHADGSARKQRQYDVSFGAAAALWNAMYGKRKAMHTQEDLDVQHVAISRHYVDVWVGGGERVQGLVQSVRRCRCCGKGGSVLRQPQPQGGSLSSRPAAAGVRERRPAPLGAAEGAVKVEENSMRAYT